jgi:DNA-binding MurR/RpiR family transcriptional regulator
VIRTARALGFSGLDELRRTLADELRQSLSPADRLTRTLGEVGTSVAKAFEVTLEIHAQSLESLRRMVTPEMFEQAVEAILHAERVFVFGLGPSSAIASYFVIQLGRFGLTAQCLPNSGLLFADDLQKLRAGDLIVMLAYGRVYTELAVLLDEIARLRLPSILLTDSLAAKLRRRVELVLPVPRGRADMLSMHTATLGCIEALLVGIAAKRPSDTLASLQALNRAREKLAGKSANLPVRNPTGVAS